MVPGWAGSYWIKHLISVEVSPRPVRGFWMNPEDGASAKAGARLEIRGAAQPEESATAADYLTWFYGAE